ncbi:response regulator [Desulfovibrio inopinatus]|uniref:response regulator n=1 Tax=Desulfovibrio inopinatus TaxID=102109 RepID=UPI0003FE2AF9|nr:response regulator [Desulfovibrio inopinatus]
MNIPPKILVIDDDDTVLASFGLWLEDNEFQVIEARNGREGLNVVNTQDPDAIILDLVMPVMDGLEFLRVKADTHPEIPVIVMTGKRDLSDAVRAFKYGAFDYLTKPLDNFELLNHALQSALEHRTLKEKIERAEKRYTNLVQHIPVLIFMLHHDFNLGFINKFCEAMLGFTQSEALSTPNWFLGRIHDADRERIRNAFTATFRKCDRPLSEEFRLIHKDGAVIHGILKTIPAQDCVPGQSVTYMESLVMDISERMMLEKFVVQKEKLKTLGAISAEVAHEIRNPLISIGGFSRRMRQKYPDIAETEIILSEATRLEKTLDRIRTYLHPVKLEREDCSINDIVESALDLLEPELLARNIIPKVKFDRLISQIRCDREMLGQVVINLMRNVSGNIDTENTLVITTFERDQFVNLEIVFHPSHVISDPELLFLPFEETETNVGLPFCYRMLKNMGGSLTFDRNEKACVFLVTLPISGREIQ